MRRRYLQDPAAALDRVNGPSSEPAAAGEMRRKLRLRNSNRAPTAWLGDLRSADPDQRFSFCSIRQRSCRLPPSEGQKRRIRDDPDDEIGSCLLPGRKLWIGASQQQPELPPVGPYAHSRRQDSDRAVENRDHLGSRGADSVRLRRSNAGSITPATLEAIISCKSNTSLIDPSNRSAQICLPLSASISWAAMRILSPPFRTEPSSRWRTPSSRPAC